MRNRSDTGPPSRPPSAEAGRAAALAAFDRGDDTAELARTRADTVPVTEAARAEDGAVTATLRFEHEGVAVDLQIRSHGRTRSVSGLVTGDFEHAVLRVRRPGSTDSPTVGEDGRFSLDGLPRGPISLSLLRSGRPPVVTAWFTV
ncbi:hypothetical protein Q8791_05870 [Nocardiopsis sp. CT-R113]|uniref:Carboxypeptidase regulatory-like domain-containing protein n=1 Tax=Nocardiopsis codii TaxID=3065942 RepID=A0ABU7K4I4_9ACTN|nr:hypothetical protein [Nocardiopsis sp. CT-R113]MEE2036749.1 hypothetical protein [Nocardiopsis sp. CT-R113]